MAYDGEEDYDADTHPTASKEIENQLMIWYEYNV